ncbi:dihydrofolate reductase [Reichenbachiella faecimaris]|uniref:Dihydrofolate reductase n=1 Tax=Reichenbachiella faecimaris TaxID=692418 RepID=A0A1W2GMA7_REIFA|nr:dihydrofolate reductase [Reichenbachiella faecimaris]SMD37799.1 dihydrofolate reductase [Reichenbachiella faecimaris]
MKISLIAAMSKNRVIGINNGLPWHLPDDMKYFMETTRGHVVIMGRKNFDSLPPKFKPLPNRTNVILTRQKDFEAVDCAVFNEMDLAYSYAKNQKEKELFVIGGGQIYQMAMEQADMIYLTEIDAHIDDGEVFFPEMGNEWQETSREHHPADDRHKYAFDFVKYEKKKK